MRVLIVGIVALSVGYAMAQPLGAPGTTLYFELVSDLPSANVDRFEIAFGDVVDEVQWLHLSMHTGANETFRAWALCSMYPSESLPEAEDQIARFIIQRNEEIALEFRHSITGDAILPNNGAWPYLIPRVNRGDLAEASDVSLLGHTYKKFAGSSAILANPPAGIRVVRLRTDVMIGVPHNHRQADETRRFDDSEYEYIELVPEDHAAMRDAGLNTFVAKSNIVKQFEDHDVFYWGVSAAEMPYPSCLYDPRYIGPALFLNEPMVVTRDHTLRPKLREDPQFRRDITPTIAFETFKEHYNHVIAESTPQSYMRQLAGREDLNMGEMRFVQSNVYSWETMTASAMYQLGYDERTPNAIVFEPPGHVGSRRLLPGMNMAYGCQIPVTDPNHFIDIIIGFCRGAARQTNKEWGISVYGSVDRAEAFPFMRRAYDLGATRFFYWDSARLACVPFGEVLTTSHQLINHANQYPHRDLDKLLHAAEVAIVFPPGYNLGHVHMVRGLIFGVPELNLERTNAHGVKYRTVMGNVFTEIERCIRDGVGFDLLWDLDGVDTASYRETIRVLEDGNVQMTTNGRTQSVAGPRIPPRPSGKSPTIALTVEENRVNAPATVSAIAHLIEGDAQIYFSNQPDSTGIHHNDRVAWEIYGPNPEDYRFRSLGRSDTGVTENPDGTYTAKAEFTIDEPGTYRIRAATTDLAGRSAVAWVEVTAR